MPSLEYGQDYADIREQVARICGTFPGEYWQDLDDKAEYPHAFVDALTESGYLAALINFRMIANALWWTDEAVKRIGMSA